MTNNSNKRTYKVEIKIFDGDKYIKAIKKINNEINSNHCGRHYHNGRLILETDYLITFVTTSRQEAINIFGLVTTYEDWDVELHSEMK